MINDAQGEYSMEEDPHKQSYILYARRLLYGLTIFVGAFLLFAIEPVAGKALLPRFGGSAGVWSAALLFFMTALLVGYVYVYFLSLLRPRVQVLIQALVLALSLVFIIKLLLSHEQGLFLRGMEGATDGLPFLQILKLLAVHIGLPFFVLSTTSSLLQSWFSCSSPRAVPYRFYALSNAGSLLALAAYPFLLEPYLPLSIQTRAWSLLFLFYGLGFFACTALFVFSSVRPHNRSRAPTHDDEVLQKNPQEAMFTKRAMLLILALAALPSLHLVATTTAITQGVASVPFFWLVPLALYLLSFVLCFSSDRIYNPSAWGALLFPGVIVSLVAWSGASSSLPIMLVLLLYSATLFLLCMFCHAELYRLRPPVSLLTAFYVLVALGGAVGAAMGSVVAPLIFIRGMWEFPLGLFCGGVLALVSISHICRRAFGDAARFFIYPALLGSLLVPLFSIIPAQYRSNVVLASRNFYGLLTVRDTIESAALTPVRFLVNGGIYHGSQFQDPAFRHVPTTYYGKGSGAGLALLLHSRRVAGIPLRVGVVGLGAGTLAAYCDGGDQFRFYEINPAVIRLAYSHFSYLADCPGEVAVVEGDARLSLEEEMQSRTDERFDVLLVDAFTDDAIPTHLLTREAFALYRDRLEPSHGVLGVHISNKHLDLAPLVAALARDVGWQVLLTEAPGVPERGEVFSRWVLASSDAAFLEHPAFASTTVSVKSWDTNEQPWTDDYSSIFQVLLPLQKRPCFNLRGLLLTSLPCLW